MNSVSSSQSRVLKKKLLQESDLGGCRSISIAGYCDFLENSGIAANDLVKRNYGCYRSGQVSVEFLQILAVSLLVLMLFLAISQNTQSDINQVKESSDAQNTISDIAGAAKEVYAQGLGAKKKVYVTIPDGVEPEKTYVANKSIRLNVAGSDYTGLETFDMHGTIPTNPGGHWIWVVSEGNKVRIGYGMISLSRQTLLVSMIPNSTKTKSFDITNIWDEEIKVELSDNWNYADISYVLDRNYDYIEDNASVSFEATFKSNDKAIGFYLSEIEIIAKEGNNKEHIKMPIIVQVLAREEERAPLTVIPPIFNATLNWTDSVNKSFQVCTNEVTSVTGVNFEPSFGEPGDWSESTTPLGPIGPDSCSPKVIGIFVPNGAALGNHTGFVEVIGKGAADAKDSIVLDIEVGGTGENEGPIVRNITTRKRRAYVGEPTIIDAIADDSERGNSSIKECLISADNETDWRQMDPLDGIFDTSIEDVYYNFTRGFEMGTHTVALKCTDSMNNVGPIATYDFIIGKSILFVIASGNESDWSNWVDFNKARATHPWDFDVANFDQINDGTYDMYYYDTVIFLDWDRDSAFVDKVVTYKELGGFAGLFGDSAHLAVRDLNVTWHPDNPHPEVDMNITNNTHYVTQEKSLGSLPISDSKIKIYEMWDHNDETIILAKSGWFSPDTHRIMLAEENRTIFWGPQDPWKLNDNGIDISVRIIDYMINNSEVS
jgi:hypothetical protein